jgi:hypothetical protein
MTEKQFHRDFEKWLRERRIPFVTSRMDRRSTIGNGKPDYCITFMNRCRYVELKTSKGRLSPAQVKEIEYIRRSGNTVEVARSLPEAIEAVHGILCEGKPSVDSYGACNYPLEGCFRELKRAVAEVPGNGTEDLSAARGGIAAVGERKGHLKIKGMPDENPACQNIRSDLAAQNFYIGDWQRTPYVFAPDIDGNYKMNRKASVIDIANLPKLP